MRIDHTALSKHSFDAHLDETADRSILPHELTHVVRERQSEQLARHPASELDKSR